MFIEKPFPRGARKTSDDKDLTFPQAINQRRLKTRGGCGASKKAPSTLEPRRTACRAPAGWHRGQKTPCRSWQREWPNQAMLEITQGGNAKRRIVGVKKDSLGLDTCRGEKSTKSLVVKSSLVRAVNAPGRAASGKLADLLNRKGSIQTR